MTNKDKYIPVSCDFIDTIEITATKKIPAEIIYSDEFDNKVNIQTYIKTWITYNSEEFLITTDDHRIRLDRIHSINGFTGPVMKDAFC